MLASSCAGLKQHSSRALNRVTDAALSPLHAIRPTQVAVVKVREKDLKKFRSGHEMAKAYEEERRRDLWIFNGFKTLPEPMLLDSSSDFSLGLLPPVDP
jgi:hypothetical protein